MANAIVTGEEPLKEEPDSPVPIVRVLVVEAVIVPLPPRATATPLNVTLEFANCAFEMVPLNAVVGMVVEALTALDPFP